MSCLAVGLVLFCGAANAKDGENALPNIIYILLDDLGYGDVSILNAESKIPTLNMDRIGREGMIFTDAHSGSAVCTPTRYGILTGRYAWRGRLKKGVLNGYSEHLIEPGRMTVASLLKENGYHTAFIGKWHLGWDWHKSGPRVHEVDYTKPVKNNPNDNGFSYFYGHCGSLDMPPYVYVENGMPTAVPDRVTENKDSYGWWRKGPTAPDFVHEETLSNFTQRGVEYIRKQAEADGPFFLYLPLPSPHTPILPTAEFQGKSGTNPYGDFVLETDWSIGQIMQALEESGVAENTLLIVTSDNGCSPKANFRVLAKLGHNPSYIYRGHKADSFEGGHRIPFLVRWPARIKAGSVSADTTCLTDLMATCAEIVGATLPNDAAEDSVSMLPNLLGVSDGPVREATVHHSIDGDFSIRQGKWKFIDAPHSGGWSDPKPKDTASWKDLPPVQLYDMEADPGETVNLQGQYPEVVERLSALLEKYRESDRSVPERTE